MTFLSPTYRDISLTGDPTLLAANLVRFRAAQSATLAPDVASVVIGVPVAGLDFTAALDREIARAAEYAHFAASRYVALTPMADRLARAARRAA